MLAEDQESLTTVGTVGGVGGCYGDLLALVLIPSRPGKVNGIEQ